MVQRWVRFQYAGETGFGTLGDDDAIERYRGDMFDEPAKTGERIRLAAVELLTPTEPSKMIGLVNNFRALLEKLNQPVPEDPLYFLKAPNSFLAPGKTIQQPSNYTGRVVFEGELGIVIGRRCKEVSEAEAGDFIFGYSCINDVTAFDLLNKDPQFAQWTRCKAFDTFGAYGPTIARGLSPDGLSIRTVLGGDSERQNYPVSDMVFAPHRLVSLLSYDMTLLPGDVIACGTSVGAGKMNAGTTVEISIDGIGTLSNRYEGVPAEVAR